jgi:site-specific DNA recombinase
MARISRKNKIESPLNLEDEKIYNVGMYVRLSVEDESDRESQSIDNQKSLIHKYIENKPWFSLVSIYSDDGFTGTNFERPDFMRLMEDLKNKKVNCVIVKDFSRFGRNYIETGNLIEKVFPFMGVRFISINDQYDSSNPNQKSDGFILPLKNIINEVYSRDISRKITSQFKVKQKKGEYLGSLAAYGYMKSTTDRHKLVVDKEAAKVVQNIFQWKLEGIGDSKIASMLNDLGILAPNKYKYELGILKKSKFDEVKYWHKSAVKRILTNQVYLGYMVQGKQKSSLFEGKKRTDVPKNEWVLVENTHEPIISKEMFEAVQKTKNNHQKKYNDSLGKYDHLGKKENILKGLVFCGDCKRLLTRHKVIKKGNEVSYNYLCPTYERNSKHGCIKKYIFEDELTAAIKETIEKQILQANSIKKLSEKINQRKVLNDCHKVNESEINIVHKGILRAKALRNALYEDYVSKVLTEKEYIFAKKKYEDDIKEMEDRLQELQIEMEEFSNTHPLENNWVKTFENLRGLELTIEILSTLVQKIEVYSGKRIEITLRYQDEYHQLIEHIRQNLQECASL